MGALARFQFVVMFIVCVAQATFAATHECGRETTQSVQFRYCIDRGDKAGNEDVVYFLHGANGSEQTWMDANHQHVRNEWDAAGAAYPTVVSISFGALWTLSEVSGRHQAFVNEIIPRIEEKLGGLKGRRMLMGESMGGMNSSLLLLKSGNLFERVVLICPAMLPVGPYSPAADVNQFYERHPYVNRGYVRSFLWWMKMEYRNNEEWMNHNPVELSKTRLSATGPKIHISCGDRDQFGFFEGAETFAKNAMASGAPVIWEVLAGGAHCAANPKAIAGFLTSN